MSKSIAISEFIEGKYHQFWEESNRSRNALDAHEQLMIVEKRCIWGAYQIKMNMKDETKTVELSGEVSKYHIAGDDTIQNSIKGLATEYKRQPAVRIFKGIGNMGSAPGDPGAAARYTSVQGTPILMNMFRHMPYVPKIVDETGLTQPLYIPTPLPMMMINGFSGIGTGLSSYFAERDPHEVMNYIHESLERDDVEDPAPISSAGAITEKIGDYVFYRADYHKDGHTQVITAIPPGTTPAQIMQTIRDKKRYNINKVKDASGAGNPIKIIVPRNTITEDTESKFHLKKARKEAFLIWDNSISTMRTSNLREIGLRWFYKRQEIVQRRIQDSIQKNNDQLHRFSLIKKYVDMGMNNWSISDIQAELKDDTNSVISMPARSFLPEEVAKQEKNSQEILKNNDQLQKDLNNSADLIFEEAEDIIKKQESFFKE